MPAGRVKVNFRNQVKVNNGKQVKVKGGAVALLLNKIQKYPVRASDINGLNRMYGLGLPPNANTMVGNTPTYGRSIIAPETRGRGVLDVPKFHPIQFARNKKTSFKESPIEFKF